MKNLLLFLSLITCLLTNANWTMAQSSASDMLYRLDRSTLTVKIREVTGTDVLYSELATPNTTGKIPKTALWKIVFSDGSSDVFNTPKGENMTVTSTKQSLMARNKPTPTIAQSSKPSVVRQETTRTQSQPTYDTDSPQSIIKYAPLSSFGYERVLSNNHSIYAGLSLYSLGFGVTALGLKGEYRFYGLIKDSPKQAPEGFWVAPTVLFWHVSDRFDETESVFLTQLGAIAGYQWIFNKKISLEPALGLSLTAVGSGSDSILGAGFVPLFAVRVGYVLK